MKTLFRTAIALTLFAGCDSDNPAMPGGNARLSVYLTDGPGDVERAWIEVLEISVRSRSDQLTLVPEVVGLVEVTDLVDEVHLLVDEYEIEAGVLSEVRVVIGDGVLESKQGDVYVLGNPELPGGLEATGELHCPSCQQSGIKIKVSNGDLDVPEGEYALVLDYDVAQTYGHRAGGSGRWIMHPVVHGEVVAVELVESVLEDLQGVVVLASVAIPECPVGTSRSAEDFVPTATAMTLVDGDGQPIVRTGVVAADGSFAIGGMEPDTYTLGYQTEFDYGTHVLAFEATVLPPEVTVTEVGVAAAAYTVTAATCSPV